MKILPTLDLFLCNYFVPNISEKNFKNRIFCLLALAYISAFKLPRKFLINYFRGNGNDMVIDTRKLILNNDLVFNKFFEAISTSLSQGSTEGSLDICQTDVHDPNYQYSIGSFTINYSFHGDSIETTADSGYHFHPYPDRLTKHLHSWLYTQTVKGSARNFKIKGNPWTTSFSELASAKVRHKPGRHPKFTVLA